MHTMDKLFGQHDGSITVHFRTWGRNKYFALRFPLDLCLASVNNYHILSAHCSGFWVKITVSKCSRDALHSVSVAFVYYV